MQNIKKKVLNLLGKTPTIETLQLILTHAQTEIIKAVLYFDVFKYPLTTEELFENSAVLISRSQFTEELNFLIKSNLLKKQGEFILTHERGQIDIERRIDGNHGARKMMPVAHEYARKIASFPFVEGVCLSGSISKNYFDERSDIDFFIIARPDRLWICRTLLMIKYKMMPESLRRNWCPNYFISSDNLRIPDINTFTGTEIAYLIPSINYGLYRKILEKNSWYKLRFPNKNPQSDKNCSPVKKSFLSKLFELIFSGWIGHQADNLLLKYTLRRWQKKFPDLHSIDFELQFRSRKDVCKRHTHGFQNKILEKWENNLSEFGRIHNLVLDKPV